MRLDNGKVKNVIISVYFILIIAAILMLIVCSSFKRSYLFLFFVFAIIFILVHRVSKYFEYDSNGLKVVITNKGLLLSDRFNYRENSLEFEKENLLSIKFKNYLFYKVLVLDLKRKSGRVSKERFNITLVSKKKRKYISQSLNKIIKNNRKQTSS